MSRKRTKPTKSFCMMLQPHEAGSVTGILFSSHRRMMAVFRPQLVQTGNQDHHQVLPPSSLGTYPPLEGSAALAHSLAGKLVARTMLDTQYIFSPFICRMVPDLDFIRVYPNEEEKRWTERANGKAKNTLGQSNRGNESRTESM